MKSVQKVAAIPRYAEFGARLREARKNRKLTQGELAQSLGVLQQAISGWERGTSRPETGDDVAALAALFPERDWAALTDHDDSIATSRGALMPAPVRPLSAVLPFHALSFEQFQDFCTALLTAHYDDAKVHQFGGPGEKQFGIDIDVRLTDGRRYVFQCKREQRFGPEKVRRALQALSVKCDLAVILLSRLATVEARREIARKRQQKWDIWDSKDIAEKIRSLPEDVRLRIVDTYFSAYRKDFLGIDQPSPFETPEKYFAPFLTRSHIFSHTWTLVGREGLLRQIGQALSGANEGALVITGPGGSGKTRLLLAVIQDYKKQHPQSSIYVLPSTAQPTPKDYEILEGHEGLIVLEDAHDRLETKAIAHALARVKPAQRVIVTCRPYALSAVCSDLASAGLPVATVPFSIDGLTKADAEAVAKEILIAKNGPDAAAKDVASVAYDSPLALVVGSHLVATKLINPKTLNNADEFRQRLLAGFRDAITGTIGLPTEASLIRGTLELIALLQPVEIDTNSFAKIAAQLIGQTVPEINRAIQLLLEGGVLIRRARRLRIVPDLLADYLIEEVLRRDGGRSGGTAEQLLAEADAEQVARLLVNTAKLDWRLSAKDETGRRLSDAVWAHLFAGSPAAFPEKLRDGVVIAAYYQPEPALRLYDRIVREGEPRDFTRLLKHVALNMDFVEEACERLWALGKKDERAENVLPDHPMRILKDLARIEPGRPIEYCGRVAGFAMTRIAGRSEAHELYSILESALNADGHTTESKGLTISFNSFTVRHDAVKELRQKIIGFLLQQLAAESIPSAVRAASVLSSALRYPDHADDDVRKKWESEFISTLDRLATAVVSGKLDANTLLAIEKSVHWHARFGMGPAHDAADRVIAAIPRTLEYQVTLCIGDAWGHTRMGRDDVTDWMERWRDEQLAVARAVLQEYRAPSAVLAFIRARLDAVRAAGERREFAPGQFVGVIASLDESLAEAICDTAISDAAIRVLFSAGLNALMRHNPRHGIEIARRALSTNAVDLTRDVSWTLGVRQGREQTIPEERATLLPLLSHADPYVAGNAIRGAVSGGLHDLPSLAAYLLTVPLGQSTHVASEFFGEVTRNEALTRTLTAPSLVPRMLEKLRPLPTIEDFWIEKYLVLASEAAPVELVEFLLARISAGIVDTERQLQPLPYLWDEKLPFAARKSPRFKDALRRIREWRLRASDHWAVRYWLPKLYVAMAGGIDDEIVRDLLEWTDTHDAVKFGVVIELLREASSQFALDHVSAVRALFERAEAIGDEACRRPPLLAICGDGVGHAPWNAWAAIPRGCTPQDEITGGTRPTTGWLSYRRTI